MYKHEADFCAAALNKAGIAGAWYATVQPLPIDRSERRDPDLRWWVRERGHELSVSRDLGGWKAWEIKSCPGEHIELRVSIVEGDIKHTPVEALRALLGKLSEGSNHQQQEQSK